MKSRESGIDLLRCVGLLFVVGVHSFLKNGYYGQMQVGAVIWAANSWRWLFYCCNGIFMMLTGYLKTKKPFSLAYYKSLIPILVSYGLICLFTFPIRHFLLGEEKSVAEWFSVCIEFGNYAWYLEMYIGLLLISPIINLALDGLQTPAKQLMLTGVMLFLTAVPSLTPWPFTPDYWTSLYPITYYMIGALIKRLQPKTNTWVCLSVVAGVAMFLGLVSVLSTDKTVSDGFGQGYGGFYITLITTALFLGLYRLSFSERMGRVLAWMAEGCFEGYLLSRLLDVWAYNLFPKWHTPEGYPLLFLCVTIPIYVLSLLAGKGIHCLTAWCLRKLQKKPGVLSSPG